MIELSSLLTFECISTDALTLENDGHYHIHVPTLYESGSFSNERIDFILDTGAYITVITRKEAALLGFIGQYTVRHDIPLEGFAGGCLADIMEIPGMVLGGQFLKGVKVAVPHVDTATNILGLNVLDLFKFLVDTENRQLHLARNPAPQISPHLQCAGVFSLSADLFEWL